MTELARWEPSTEIQRQSTMQDAAVERLGAWAASAQAAYEVADKLVQTSFVPEAFRNKPFEACAAILAGTEVGLSPLASLRSFDLINGTAAPRAITLRAIVQSQGHEIILVESTATRCKMRGRRRGDTSWQEVAWTMDRAKALGLTGKHNWKAQPQAMLVARATSELCRLVAADAILGIGLSVEEVADGVEPDPTGAPTDLHPPPNPARTRKMSRKKITGPPGIETTDTQAANIAEVPLEPANEAEDGITKKQIGMLHKLFNDHGITDRKERMARTVAIIGREVQSSKDLTKAEASQVIDELQNALEQPFKDQQQESP